jgi:hypothetical protein
MGILDPKTRILDVVLTARGKEQLAKNQLNFKYYAFSDEGIDYSGSLDTVGTGSAFDDHIHRAFSLEADQRVSDIDGKEYARKDLDLQTFLYTIPAGTRILPEFRSNYENEDTINLVREYVIEYLTTNVRKTNDIKEPEAMVVQATVPEKTIKERMEDYITKQQTQAALEALENARNIIGFPFGPRFFALNERLALNAETGDTTPIPEEPEELESSNQVEIAEDVKQEVELVLGRDEKKIEFALKTKDGEISSPNGFLIEIYESGSNGKLKKLVKETVVDPLSDDTLQDGYDSFLILKVDE